MFSKRNHDRPRSVAFRLTLWFTGLFGVLSVCAFTLVYVVLVVNLDHQIDQDMLSDTIEFDALYRQNGLESLQNEFDREAKSEGVGRFFFRILSPGGNVLAQSNLSAWGDLPAVDVSRVTHPMWRRTRYAIYGEQTKVRTLLAPTPSGEVFQIGRVVGDKENITERFAGISLLTVVLMIVIGGFIGWRMAKSAMKGVNRVTQTALAIGGGNLKQRVPVDPADGHEVVELSFAFNQMLERIDMLIRQLHTISDNIAHDLRSPITRIRGVAEVVLTGPQDIQEYRETNGVIIEEADRLVEMINTMLDIARVETGLSQAPQDLVDLGKLVAEACELFQPVADARGVEMAVEAVPDTAWVLGNSSMLQRVIANLIDNAIKYAPDHGRVIAAVSHVGDQCVVTISDNGKGIDPADLPHIFDRFYRGDRSRSTPGHGLGLSLALAFIQAHGGTIHVDNSADQGCRFQVHLPRPATS